MNKIKKSDVQGLIRMALKEDIGDGDITSTALFDKKHKSSARIISRDTGVFCGCDMIRYVFEAIDKSIRITLPVRDGENIVPGARVAELYGPTISLLSGERTVLNFIQRMSGIATKTKIFAEILKGTGIKILDTRKTLPGFRMLDKYAVFIGGGTNHRFGLWDMVLIKDNHIRAAGGITNAVNIARKKYGKKFNIEVEASTPAEAGEAASSGADIIMLDNMPLHDIEEAIKIIQRRAKIEVSGNMNEEKIKQLIHCDIDFISAGALTHSVKAFDLSMKFDSQEDD